MKLKLFAAISLAGVIVTGAAVLANATPVPAESGPSMSNSATTTTSTSAASVPTYRGGY